MLDGNARMNLATFVTTWMEPQAERLMSECFDKNMIDKDEYPQTAELEERCVDILARLWHAPEGDQAAGCSTTGSSEAAMLGGLALKRRWQHRAARPRASQRTGPTWSWGSTSRSAGRSSPTTGTSRCGSCRWRATATTSPLRRRSKLCDENTIGVVAVLGSTFDGSLRAGRGDLRGARRAAGADRARRAGPRRRRVRRIRRAVPRPGPGVGLPAAARHLDQHLGPQVRTRVPGRRLGRVARRRRAARGPGLLGELPGRQHADVRTELLAPGRAGRRPVLQLPAPRVRRVREGAGLRARGGDPAGGRGRAGSGRSS